MKLGATQRIRKQQGVRNHSWIADASSSRICKLGFLCFLTMIGIARRPRKIASESPGHKHPELRSADSCANTAIWGTCPRLDIRSLDRLILPRIYTWVGLFARILYLSADSTDVVRRVGVELLVVVRRMHVRHIVGKITLEGNGASSNLLIKQQSRPAKLC